MTNLNHADPSAQIRREQIAFEYTCALDRGDFDRLDSILALASDDPILEQMLDELTTAHVENSPELPDLSASALRLLLLKEVVRSAYDQRPVVRGNAPPKRLRRSPSMLWVATAVLVMTLCLGSLRWVNVSSPYIGADIYLNNDAPNSKLVEISIVYSGEVDQYLPQIIVSFNQAYRQGRNPLTDQPLVPGEPRIIISGHDMSSGDVLNLLVNATLTHAQDDANLPTMWGPSSSPFLTLANYRSGHQLCNVQESQPTAYAPVVIAIWKSRLEAIRNTVGYDDIGWQELLDVLHSPNGWQDYGVPDGHRSVFYGHTDPMYSPTALSALMSEFMASARRQGNNDPQLTLSMANDPEVLEGVRDIEQLIRHYARRTTEFKEYIAQGPDYLDFVALEENDVIYINEGLTEYDPPEPLVALYPKEGTFMHEHPICILNADWTSSEQRDAAHTFVNYVLREDNQQMIMEHGFRPANPNVSIGYPFAAENGVDPAQPTNVLSAPSAEVLAAVQQNWRYVRKQADVMLLIDVSSSMHESDKLAQAQAAALAFIDNMQPSSRIGLASFSDNLQVLVPIQPYEVAEGQMRTAISQLQPQGGTGLYDALRDTVNLMNEDSSQERIRAIVLLSDGSDTRQDASLSDALEVIAASQGDVNPVIVIPIAYGSDADVIALSSIARASATRLVSGDPDTIESVLRLISGYF